MQSLDALDNRIIRELGSHQLARYWNIRESYSNIARRNGASEDTIRRRVKRAEERGLIQGWRTVVHPNTIDCVDVFLDFQVSKSEKKQEIIKLLELGDSTVLITDFEGSGLFLLIYSKLGDSLSRNVQFIETLCGAPPLTVLNSLFPVCGLRPLRTDWKIIRSIRDEPRKSISQIAREVGVTTRTVNRRLNLLTKERAFFLMGLPDFGRLDGKTANFLILLSNEKDGAKVSQKISSRYENIIYQGVFKGVLLYDITFPDISEAEEAYRWIRNREGVKSARMGIINDLAVVNRWTDEQLKSRLERV